MFEILNSQNEVIALADEPRYVYRSPKSGIWIRCTEAEAECLAVNGKRFSIRGRAPVDDAPDTVEIKKADTAAHIRRNMLSAIEHAHTIDELKDAYTDIAEAFIEFVILKEANHD